MTTAKSGHIHPVTDADIDDLIRQVRRNDQKVRAMLLLATHVGGLDSRVFGLSNAADRLYWTATQLAERSAFIVSRSRRGRGNHFVLWMSERWDASVRAGLAELIGAAEYEDGFRYATFHRLIRSADRDLAGPLFAAIGRRPRLLEILAPAPIISWDVDPDMKPWIRDSLARIAAIDSLPGNDYNPSHTSDTTVGAPAVLATARHAEGPAATAHGRPRNLPLTSHLSASPPGNRDHHDPTDQLPVRPINSKDIKEVIASTGPNAHKVHAVVTLAASPLGLDSRTFGTGT